MKIFLIAGYWKESKIEFNNYLVTEHHNSKNGTDYDIFYYGLSETNIQQAIRRKEDTKLEFVITNYTLFK